MRNFLLYLLCVSAFVGGYVSAKYQPLCKESNNAQDYRRPFVRI